MITAKSYNEQGAELFIGNQWQWQHFTIGYDWIGFYAPMAQQNKQSDVEKSENGRPFVADYSAEPKSIEKTGYLRLLSFYLGFTF